jgi:ATP-dependent Lon protease
MKSTDPTSRALDSLPLVPLRDMVVFPHMMQPFVVGRESSIKALEAALASPAKRLFLAAQRDPQLDEPRPEDIFDVGVIATVAQSLKLPNGHIKVMVEGVRRGRIMAFERRGEYLSVAVEPMPLRPADVESLKEYMAKVLSLFEQYAKLSHHLAFEGLAASLKIDDPERFADTLSAHIAVATAEKQALLEAESPYERLQKLQDLLEVEIDKVNIDRRINNKVKKQMEKAQKEYYLNEKIKAIHQELGRKDDRTDEVEDLKKKIETSGMPKEVREKADQELRRLEAMPPVSAEATVSRNYIEWLVGVPWKKSSRESKDLTRAEKILNDDHYGLEKVKERILEFLAVRQLVQKTKGSIICFVGPPGVGKTSTASSCASPWAACATRRRSGATGAHTSARFRARSSR